MIPNQKSVLFEIKPTSQSKIPSDFLDLLHESHQQSSLRLLTVLFYDSQGLQFQHHPVQIPRIRIAVGAAAGPDFSLMGDVPGDHVFAARGVRSGYGEDEFSLPRYPQQAEDLPALRVVGQVGYPGEAHCVVFPPRVRMLRTLDAGLNAVESEIRRIRNYRPDSLLTCIRFVWCCSSDARAIFCRLRPIPWYLRADYRVSRRKRIHRPHSGCGAHCQIPAVR